MRRHHPFSVTQKVLPHLLESVCQGGGFSKTHGGNGVRQVAAGNLLTGPRNNLHGLNGVARGNPYQTEKCREHQQAQRCQAVRQRAFRKTCDSGW